MATLTVWKFPSPYGADTAEYTLNQLEEQGLIKVHDAAIVTWEVSAKQPSTRVLKSTAGSGARGGLWGLLFGLLFSVPVLGLAVGVVTGTMRRKLSKAGIDDDFVRTVREKVTPGTSALFLMTSDAVMDRVQEAFASQEMELISTNLTAEQEEELREALAE